MIHLILILEQSDYFYKLHKFALLFPLTLDPVIRVAGQSGTGKLEAWKPSPPVRRAGRAWSGCDGIE